MKPTKHIAIVGAGPRGLSALECLYTQNCSKYLIKTLLFEATEHLGCGPIYAQEQPDSNWLNISERFLEIEARQAITLDQQYIPTFPSYHEWTNYNTATPAQSPDYYPPRSKLGRYLQERFWSIAGPLQKEGHLSIIPKKVQQVIKKGTATSLKTEDGRIYTSDEILLTIGHQPTDWDQQIEKWQSFATKTPSIALFKECYPIRQFLNHSIITTHSTIALRGFGLAMMDVVRGILEGLGGRFVKNETNQSVYFKGNKHIPKQFVPFSLDGLPMAPKPLNQEIDNWFKPTTEELQYLSRELDVASSSHAPNIENNLFLIQAFAPLAASIFSRLSSSVAHQLSIESIKNQVVLWLGNLDYQHELIIPKHQAAVISMQHYIEMALGNAPISLDYCIGQVWRHCQPTFYKKLSFHNLSNEVAQAIITLDERMKRYAYGPPVDSLQQLVALVDKGLLNLDFVHNPSINLSKTGWQISSNHQSIEATVMIDTVLDSPQLLKVSTPIIRHLLKDELIAPIHDQLGLITDRYSYALSQQNSQQLPIAVLGRLCKGTVLGVDAILECFGERSHQWASKAVL